MPGAKERTLRRRIQSVQATKKITHAMELIAASQIVRAQSRIRGAKPYVSAMQTMVAEAAADAGGRARKLVEQPSGVKRATVLVVAGDRGLCGAYNSSVLRAAERLLQEHESAGVNCELIAVGRKVEGYFHFHRRPLAASFTGVTDRPDYKDATEISRVLIPGFLEGEVDLIQVISTRFISAGTQRVEIRPVLPVPPLELPEGSKAKGYVEFEPDSDKLLQILAPAYAEALVFATLLEASASEHTARQRAMAAATENAEELVRTVTRQLNRVRQDAITTEIMEIVGGAEALRQAHAPDELEVAFLGV